MKWEDHNKWASKLGISEDVAQEVNKIIDAVNQGKAVPSEYEKYLEICSKKLADEKGAAKGNSALGMVIAENTKRGHDQSRKSTTAGDIAASVQLCAMKKMGDAYTDAWYLHHHLDYLHENRNSGKNFDELNEDYREEYPLTHSEEIEKFLTKNREDLTDDLGL